MSDLERLAQSVERMARLARAIADLDAQDLLDAERIDSGLRLLESREREIAGILSAASAARGAR